MDEDKKCGLFDPTCTLAWIAEELRLLVLWAYDSILSSIASLIESFPVPDFMLNPSTINITGGMAYFAQPFELVTGIKIVVAAYTARFILRRIPIIG